MVNEVGEKYCPYLIGAPHHPAYAQQTIDLALKLNTPTLVVEISKAEYERIRIGKSINPLEQYYLIVIEELKRNGKEIVFLTPNPLSRRLSTMEKKLFKQNYAAGEKYLAEMTISGKIKGTYQALVQDTLTRFIEKKALKLRPGIIIIGAGHAIMIKKDLGIPGKKTFFVQNKQLREILEKSARGIAWFRRKRKIRRKVKIAISKIRKNIWR